MKIKWEIYPICQFLEPVLKIFQIRQVHKKIDNNSCTFFVSKVAFYGTYDLYKFFFIPYQVACVGAYLHLNCNEYGIYGDK